MTRVRAIKGMHDALPEESARFRDFEERFRALVSRHGYGEVRTPVVEPTELFLRSIGEATDIVEKEMYSFVDKGDDALTLRPEGTASAVRAYLEHNVVGREPVSKWFYTGPMFRRERPAKGRYRQFHQAGCEVYGDAGPYLDAEMIDMVVGFVRDLGVSEVEVLVNSLGSGETRVRYRDALQSYFAPHAAALSEDSQRRLQTNPLRILDSKDPRDIALADAAPTILEHLSDDDRAHFDGLRETLDALGTPYRVDARLVRGLDYYTRTLFEVRGNTGGAQNALLGGGRYDGMIAELGGQPTPAIGFAMGIERMLLAMGATPAPATLDVVILTVSPTLRKDAVVLGQRLRAEGLRVESDLRGGSLKSQFRRADKLAPTFALILGEAELSRGAVGVKRLATSESFELPLEGLAAAIRGVAAP